MRVSAHPAAERDLRKAATFYRDEASDAVAARFLAEYDRVIRFLLERPGAGSPRDDVSRVFSFHGFPYSVVYREIPDGIRVLVVKHDRQRPEFGERRR